MITRDTTNVTQKMHELLVSFARNVGCEAGMHTMLEGEELDIIIQSFNRSV